MSLSFLNIANIETLYFDRIYALHGLTLTISPGEIFAILGPNGSGKTTLLRTIAGLIKDQPKKGIIEFMGRPIQRASPELISSLGIVYVPEDRGLFRELTVAENLELGLWGRRGSEAAADVAYVENLFPILKDRRRQQAETLSGGEQQMLAIARALLRKPKLLMLDEPSLGLAPIVARHVCDALLKIRSGGTTILLVEQNANLALKIADYGYILEGGKIVLKGTAQELITNPDVREFYLGTTGGRELSPKGWRLYRKRRSW